MKGASWGHEKAPVSSMPTGPQVSPSQRPRHSIRVAGRWGPGFWRVEASPLGSLAGSMCCPVRVRLQRKRVYISAHSPHLQLQ